VILQSALLKWKRRRKKNEEKEIPGMDWWYRLL